MTEAFDPGRYLSRVNGADYLEVKFRLVWLRDRHPNAAIDTVLVHHDLGKMAVFRCTITIPEGGSATGYGQETVGDFRDYLEKAETKAIGRACAALGFGTQFCPDHDFGGDAGRVVDSPIDRTRYAATRTTANGQDAAPTDRSAKVTQAHLNALHGAGANHRPPLDHEAITAQAWARFTVGTLKELSQRQHAELMRFIESDDLIEIESDGFVPTEEHAHAGAIS